MIEICYRYKLFCAKKESISCERLPPCKAGLYQHCLRANYQAKLRRECLVADIYIPSPTDHGWCLSEGQLCIKWMDCKSAPEEVILTSFNFLKNQDTFSLEMLIFVNVLQLPYLGKSVSP